MRVRNFFIEIMPEFDGHELVFFYDISKKLRGNSADRAINLELINKLLRRKR